MDVAPEDVFSASELLAAGFREMFETNFFPNRILARAMMSKQRRLAAQKAFDRVRRAGLQTEEDPRFLGWIEQWILGEIDMQELRERYLGLLRERALERNTSSLADVAKAPFDPLPEPPTTEETDEFLSGIADG